MTSQREAFEKWANEYALDLEPLTVKGRHQDCEAAYLTAQADKAERVKELEKAGADLIRINMERTTENAQLQLENQKLREALEFECGGRCNAEYNPCNAREVLQALGETK